MVFVGNAFDGSTSMQRFRAFKDLGYESSLVPNAGHFDQRPSIYRRIRHRLGLPFDAQNENSALFEAVTETRPSFVWIEKGLTLRRKTLARCREAAPGIRFISFSADDMMNPLNQSHWWRQALPDYDVHVTTKTHNIAELQEAGARQVVFMPKSFGPETHRPIKLSDAERKTWGGDVAFVGSYESERATSIRHLAANGIPVRVWGNGWDTLAGTEPNLQIEGRAVYGDDYARVLCATAINLCFLRKMNRDQQTARSVEIPACGAFMLAERTDEHRGLFAEDLEASYFADDRELLDKVRHYLGNPTERAKVSAAGRQRCLDSEYSHAARLRAVIAEAM